MEVSGILDQGNAATSTHLPELQGIGSGARQPLPLTIWAISGMTSMLSEPQLPWVRHKGD